MWNSVSALLVNLIIFITIYHGFCQEAAKEHKQTRHITERNSAGYFNNPSHPFWGSAGQPVECNHYEGHPVNVVEINKEVNVRKASTRIFQASQKHMKKSKRFSTLFAFFGQLVAKEIIDTNDYSCPRDILPTDVSNDTVYKSQLETEKLIYMPYYRVDYDKKSGHSVGVPRRQINQVSSWIDGSFIYGPSEIWSDNLRSFKNGMLNLDENNLPPLNTKILPLDNYPPPRTHKLTDPGKFWAVGDRGAHENPALLSLSILFMRYHNKVASQDLANKLSLGLSDEEIFQVAKSKVVATLQSIIYYEWLPTLLDENTEPYNGYNPTASPNVDNTFATIASQWFMKITPSYIQTKSTTDCSSGTIPTLRLCNSWFDGQWMILNHTKDADPVEEILLGLSSQAAESELGDGIVEDLQDYYYGPLHFSRTDALAMAMMKGRDFGVYSHSIHDMMGVESVGLEKLPQLLEHLNIDQKKHLKDLQDTYGQSDHMDLLPLLLLEREADNSRPGKYTKLIIKEQLERVRNADRWWFENRRNNLLTDSELADIQRRTFRDVMRTVFGGDNSSYNTHMFRVDERGSCVLRPVNISELERCLPLKTFDYFSGNEFAFIVSWIWLGLLPLLILGIAYAIYKRGAMRELPDKLGGKRYSDVEMDASSLAINERYAWEWDDSNDSRPVIVCFDSNCVLRIKSLSGNVLRTVNLGVYDMITVETCEYEHPFYLLIHSPREYDLVLCFCTADELVIFSKHLRSFLKKNERIMVRNTTTGRQIRKKAITRKKRRARLEEFFKKVFAHAFNVGYDQEQDSYQTVSDRDLAEFEVSQHEFADALGMKPNSDFVIQMFDLADKRKVGLLRFRDILELVVIMSRGSTNKKMEMLFEMFDFDKDGMLHRDEMTQLAKSMIDLAGSKLSTAELDNVVAGMFQEAGCGDKQELDFEDFKRMMMKGDKNMLENIDVDWKVQVSFLLATTMKVKGGPLNARDQSIFDLDRRNQWEVAKDLVYCLERPRVLQSIDFAGMKNVRKSTPSQAKRKQQQLPLVQFGDEMEGVLHSKKSIKQKKRPAESVKYEPTDSEDEDWMLERKSPKSDPNGHMTVKPSRSINFTKRPLEKLKFGQEKRKQILNWIENRKREISIMFIYVATCVYLFYERFMHYYQFNEHNGARQTLSLGVCFARGAAEVMSFSFSLMLLTMCYNLLRYLRETQLNFYIPFDKNIVFHKVVAWTGIAFTAVHSIAYGFNYYFLASGPAHHACFFKESSYQSNEFIRIAPTLYTSNAGVTGLLLVIILMVMYIFASQTARRYMHNTFWISHKFFIALYILMAVHGLGWLTQKPHFIYYFCAPGAIFIVDKILSVSRRKMKLSILKAELLPSNVTKVMFKRPPSFEYKSGMWVRIAVDSLGTNEYHPFTLTSSPHEDFLSLHIRGVGPWTKNLRSEISKTRNSELGYPSVFVDGPFGSGQQDWFNFEVSVLVGAGIGVTPYASILKDFVHMMRTKNRFRIKCQKVYFIWSTSNQRSFEWLIDILKQVEEVDINNTVSINIFITQFFQRFDLRTSMLYVFEEHAKRLGGCSLFTGLKATTNFGRPNFLEAFNKISDSHHKVKKIGVFSCGPPGITKGVETACIKASAETRAQFQHHYENF